jgi:hypothetical protein
MPTQQIQGPEFKPQYCQKKESKEELFEVTILSLIHTGDIGLTRDVKVLLNTFSKGLLLYILRREVNVLVTTSNVNDPKGSKLLHYIERHL